MASELLPDVGNAPRWSRLQSCLSLVKRKHREITSAHTDVASFSGFPFIFTPAMGNHSESPHVGSLVTGHRPECSQLTSACAICRWGWPGTLHLSPALGEAGAAAALMEELSSWGSGSVCSLPGPVPRRQSRQGRRLDPTRHYQQSLVHVSSSARWLMINAGAQCPGEGDLHGKPPARQKGDPEQRTLVCGPQPAPLSRPSLLFSSHLLSLLVVQWHRREAHSFFFSLF